MTMEMERIAGNADGDSIDKQPDCCRDRPYRAQAVTALAAIRFIAVIRHVACVHALVHRYCLNKRVSKIESGIWLDASFDTARISQCSAANCQGTQP